MSNFAVLELPQVLDGVLGFQGLKASEPRLLQTDKTGTFFGCQNVYEFDTYTH